MTRTMVAGVLTVALLTGNTLGGPPEGVSGRMVLDEVAHGLRQYRKETDKGKRALWLEKLGRNHDVRVTVALGEWLEQEQDGSDDFVAVGCMLVRHVLGHPGPCGTNEQQARSAARWWNENNADLRRRAKELPR